MNHEEIHTSVKPVDPEELARLLNAARRVDPHIYCRSLVRGTVFTLPQRAEGCLEDSSKFGQRSIERGRKLSVDRLRVCERWAQEKIARRGNAFKSPRQRPCCESSGRSASARRRRTCDCGRTPPAALRVRSILSPSWFRDDVSR